MRARVFPGGAVSGEARVPGDKSIAHRWLILAATALGRSVLRGLPGSLDVLATARCLERLAPSAAPQLEAWRSSLPPSAEDHGFTWDPLDSEASPPQLEVEGEGRAGLREPAEALDCGNSGTTMRLLAGVVSGAPFRTVLVGDESLTTRPMERVAEPLRAMGARVQTRDGHAPMVVEGGPLRGIVHRVPVPSAQVKGSVLLAGTAASGVTVVEESSATRDHTERALAALGAPVEIEPGRVRARAFQHEGFGAAVPGDVSSAAFLVAAAALSGSELMVRDVGLNPSRTGFLQVLERMGAPTEVAIQGEELGEPVGDLRVRPGGGLAGVRVAADELPLVIDEVPVLAVLAAHAAGESRFAGAGELRVKESDRVSGLAEGIRAMGGRAAVEGDDLVVGGGGLRGGVADARGDHRLAMAFAVAAVAAGGPVEVERIESAAVSFPGFVSALVRLGTRVEV